MQTSHCLSYRSLQERRENVDDEEEMEGKRRDYEDMQDSLVVEEGMIVKFHLVPFATC